MVSLNELLTSSCHCKRSNNLIQCPLIKLPWRLLNARYVNRVTVVPRLQEEVDRVMSQTTPETFYEDLNDMDYLEQILQETLRLYPVAVATTRTNYSDQVLGKTLIPAGSTIMVGIYQ